MVVIIGEDDVVDVVVDDDGDVVVVDGAAELGEFEMQL